MRRSKVFYLGFQRAATKSFGRFLELNGYTYATWDVSRHNRWPEKCSNGDYRGIIQSKSFRFYDVFVDGPWFQPELVRFLYHEIEDSKFVLLTRPAEDWFKSMITLNAGLTFGDLQRHCEFYDRLEDYEWLRKHIGMPDDMRLSLFDKPGHYMNVYRKKNLEMKLFFERMPDSAGRAFIGELYDPDKYQKLAAFLGIRDPIVPESAVHTTTVTPADVLDAVRKGQEAAIAHTDSVNERRPRGRRGAEGNPRAQLKRSPDNYALYLTLAGSLFRQRKLDEAEEMARSGLAVRNGVPKLHVLLSRILEKKGDPAGAIEQMRAAIDTIDDYALYHHRLGLLLAAAGRPDEAAQSLKKAAALAPDNPRMARALKGVATP